MIDGNLNMALQLLFVGMISVFVILSLVVVFGRLLIYSVNKFTPAIELAGLESDVISKKDLAILSSTVDNITAGKGVISSVKKL